MKLTCVHTTTETSADKIPVPPPDPTQYFTFLYGLFPCNTIRFLRAPIDYLRKACYESPFEGDWEDMIDEIAIQTRSANVLRRHALHPALISLNAEKEVQDKQRWMRYEPADITAECMSLYLGAWHDQSLPDASYAMRNGSISLQTPLISAQALLTQGISGTTFGERDLDHSLSMPGTLMDAEEPRGRSGPVPHLDLEADPSSSFGAGSASMTQFGTALGGPSRRGSSTGVSVSSSSPLVRAADAVATRAAVNAEDILMTYAALKRGDPVTTPQRDRSADLRHQAVGQPPRFLSRSTTWTPEGSADQSFAQNAATARSGSTSRAGGLSGIPTPVTTPGLGRFKISGTSSAGLVLDTSTSVPGSPKAHDYAETSADRGRRGAVPPSPRTHVHQDHYRGSLSRGNSPSRQSTDTNAMHRHALSASLSAATRSTDSSSRPARAEVYAHLSSLQRENLMLRNELNFELYLKEQHLRHIGRLHRERVSDTALEAERQNLYYTVRSLRAQLANVTSSAEKQRAEAATIKTRHLTWENEQNSRLKSFREERRTWVAEMQNLVAQLEEANNLIKAQENQMEEAVSARFEAEARLAIAEPKLKKIEEYDVKVKQLSSALAHWESEVQKYEEQRREMEVLLSRWTEMQMLLETMDMQVAESEKREEEAQQQVEELRARLGAAKTHEKEASDRMLEKIEAHVPEAEASLRLQAEHYAKRNAELEAQCLRLKAQLGEAVATKEYAKLREDQASNQETEKEDALSPAEDTDVTELQLP